MNVGIWETLFTALQAWEAVGFSAVSREDERLERQAYEVAVDWLLSVVSVDDFGMVKAVTL